MENWKNKIVNGVLDLGTMNGWGDETNQLFDFLRQHKIENSGSGQNLGRCYNAYSFNADVNGQILEVRYRVDSSD